MHHLRLPAPALALALSGAFAFPACSDDGAGAGADDAPGDSTAGDGGEGEDGDGDGDGGSDALAHDITIEAVELNQGVSVAIVAGGAWVTGAERNAPVISGRKAIIRAYWTTTPDFVPRPIEARLTLEYSDGATKVETAVVTVESESFAGDLERSFIFDLLEEEVAPGVDFSVALYEVEEAFAELPPPAVAPFAPADGELAPVGVQPEALAIEIVVVPVHVEWDGCSTTPPAQELLPLFEEMMFMKNPTQRASLSVRDQPIVLTAPLASLWQMMTLLQDARFEDDAPPNVYYYGLMDACSTGIDGAGGMAHSTPPATEDVGWQRVATGLWYGDDQWAADTFVHEVGHLQGLAHVYCPGESADAPDPAYPYDDGVIGVWGFGLRDFQLYSPTLAHDYMSYCYSGNWSSDWTWSKNFDRIRALTSWEDGGVPAQTQDILVGVLPDDGSDPLWWVAHTRGGVPQGAELAVPATARTAAGLDLNLPAARQRMADGAATLVSVELPPPAQRAGFAALTVAGAQVPLDLL